MRPCTTARAGRSDAAAAPALQVRGLRFGWPGNAPCLDVPAFDVGAGERVFLHGPSGSGKTTLLSILSGILAPQSGAVAIGGFDLGALAAGARDGFRADHVGVMFQQFNLIPYLSALDNVLLSCGFSRRRRLHATERGGDVRSEAMRLLGSLGIAPALARRPAAALSVGEQQRVAAARALIGRPALLIADEPTSALDDGNARIFLDLLLAECTPPSALLLVSHDLRLAHRFDRSAAMTELNLAPRPETGR